MAISKCPKLKTLRLRSCAKVGTCAAYIFLSARFGFENIEVLDLRETAISDAEVRAFKSKPKLKRLYIDGRVHRYVHSETVSFTVIKSCCHTGDKTATKSTVLRIVASTHQKSLLHIWKFCRWQTQRFRTWPWDIWLETCLIYDWSTSVAVEWQNLASSDWRQVSLASKSFATFRNGPWILHWFRRIGG